MEAIVLLLWASWADPSRPSVTVARELARKHHGGVEVLALDIAAPTVTLPPGTEIVAASPGSRLTGEVPSDLLIDRLRVDVIPTWIRFERSPARTEDDLPAWCEVVRREGARPKHDVEGTIFRPSTRSPAPTTRNGENGTTRNGENGGE